MTDSSPKPRYTFVKSPSGISIISSKSLVNPGIVLRTYLKVFI